MDSEERKGNDYDRVCKKCGETKCIVDFPVELEPIVPGISEYCVECATKILEASNRGRSE